MRKNTILLTLVFVAVLVALFLGTTRLGAAKPNVLLDMAPSTASILIDGNKVHVYKTGVVVSPGKHTIEAILPGFTVFQSKITVSTSGSQTLTVVLDPVTDAGYAFLRANPKEELHREAINSKRSDDTGKAIAIKNPVTTILPYIDQYFRIDYGSSKAHPNDSTAIAVYITSFAPDGKQRALALLSKKGFDPSKLEIIYSGQ
jgi:hypothetical protein